MNIQSILIVTFCILIGLMIYMSISLFQIKKLSKKKKSSLSDPRYFELKYQHQLFISIATIIVFLVSFFGWNSLEGIKKNFDEQLAEYDEKFIEKSQTLKNLEDKQYALNETFGSFEKNVTNKQEEENASMKLFKQKLDNNTLLLDSLFKSAESKVHLLQIDLNGLSNIIAKNPSIYIVKKKVAGILNPIAVLDTIYFKDCISINSDMPKFDSPPVVISIDAEECVTGAITNINKDFFQFTVNSYAFGNYDDSLFTYFMILYFKKPEPL